jgi:hypothetical protein
MPRKKMIWEKARPKGLGSQNRLTKNQKLINLQKLVLTVSLARKSVL